MNSVWLLHAFQTVSKTQSDPIEHELMMRECKTGADSMVF